jgi:TPR repeat protein
VAIGFAPGSFRIDRPTSFVKRLRAAVALAAASALLTLPAAQAASGVSAQFPEIGRPVAGVAGLPELFDALGEAAEQGDVEAMNSLGVLFAANARVASDYSMALYWFQRAVDAGSVSAMHNMAHMYLRGLGVARDYANAFRWFRRAADGGNASAMHSVAAMAENGLGTGRDLPLARSMYHKAAESGVALAMMWVSADLARDGASQDLVAAYAWLEVAALFELDGQLQVVVLARMEDLGNRLGPVKRDEARSRAVRTVADIRARAARGPSPQVSPASTRRLAAA